VLTDDGELVVTFVLSVSSRDVLHSPTRAVAVGNRLCGVKVVRYPHGCVKVVKPTG
jgi:hypothetical protein